MCFPRPQKEEGGKIYNLYQILEKVEETQRVYKPLLQAQGSVNLDGKIKSSFLLIILTNWNLSFLLIVNVGNKTQ